MQSQQLNEWIHQAQELCEPDNVYYCNGSQEEYDNFCQQLVDQKTFIRLNPKLRPNSFLCRSDPSDVSRVEQDTFICTKTKEDAGPTNNWRDPTKMKTLLTSLFRGCMKGRTMYVIPFCMGPIGSPFSRLGVQITDSLYVVCSMRIMTHMGQTVWNLLKHDNANFVPCFHSVGVPLEKGKHDVPWPCNKEHKYIVHFPETKEIWSFGSGYGGNALLGKKSFALRIASVIGHEEGWLAEHMLIMGLTNPQGEKKYIAAAFPSACGKTNLAMMTPTLPGWRVEVVGDDIAWMRFDKDGQLYAINPEAGFFGVASGTSMKSNPNAMLSIKENTIFTNVALTDEGDVWWEGMTDMPPQHLINWLGHDWTPESKEKAAHPNSRFTVSVSQCPVKDENWKNPSGVPISAILFGGRRSSVVPLVLESFNWQHGVFLGATISSETTAAAVGELGKLRHDPFAMLPFCGYNMGNYFTHWLKLGQKYHLNKLPRIYYVNWFRKDANGKFLWPGFGENSRVLKWIFERTTGIENSVQTPIGNMPAENSLDLNNLNIDPKAIRELFDIDPLKWKEEVKEMQDYFTLFGKNLPPEIQQQLNQLKDRIENYVR